MYSYTRTLIASLTTLAAFAQASPLIHDDKRNNDNTVHDFPTDCRSCPRWYVHRKASERWNGRIVSLVCCFMRLHRLDETETLGGKEYPTLSLRSAI